MKRNVLWLGVIVLALVVAFYAGVSAAAKSYQFTGTVKSNEGGTLVVEKTPKEVWTFSTDSATKGAAKAGEKVTVYYKMIATEIEAKAATKKK